jgi:hypothetical protein
MCIWDPLSAFCHFASFINASESKFSIMYSWVQCELLIHCPLFITLCELHNRNRITYVNPWMSLNVRCVYKGTKQNSSRHSADIGNWRLELRDWATGWTTGLRFSAGSGDISFCHRVQIGSGAYPTSYPVGTVGGTLFPGIKQPGHQVHVVPRLRMSRDNTSSYPVHLHGVVLR